MRFTVVYEQESDGGYVVTVPVLPGCVSQGDNREEAANNIREAIQAYIEALEKAGEAIPVDVGCETLEIGN